MTKLLEEKELAEIRGRDAQMPDVVFDEKISAEIEIWDAPLARDRRRLLLAYDALLAELHEQARLNGMGSEREARLIAERDAMRAALEKAASALEGHPYTDGMQYAAVEARAALSSQEQKCETCGGSRVRKASDFVEHWTEPCDCSPSATEK